MLEAIDRLIQPILHYPFATGFHWLLCGIAGFLEVNSSNHGGAHARGVSMTMIAFFIAYEWTEFLRIHDSVEADIAQGFAAYLLAGLATWALHKWRH